MLKRFTIDETTGERIPIGEDTTVSPKSQQASKLSAGKQTAKERKDNHYEQAMKVAAMWNQPLVFFAGDFWTFHVSTGWTVCTKQLHARANQMAGTASDRTLMAILQTQLSLPGDTSRATFWQMTGNFWNPQWVPITPSHTEVLFSDGIYNLMTDEFKEFDKIIFGPFLTTKWITEDGDEPVCHEFQELVEAQFPDLAERNHLQEVMSTVLQPHVPLRGQIVLFGVPYSRKTTLATAIACAGAGRSGMSQVQEATLVRDKFATHALLHKMVNVSDDSPRTNRWVGFVKQYTSGNMTVEPKFHQPVSVTPTAKLISTCNEVQSLLDSSGAATDRLYLFELKHSFEKIHGSSDSVRMTAEYWSEPSRRAGVCAWLVNGLKRLRARGRFAPPDSWTAALDKAKAEADEIACQLLDSFEPGGSDDFVAMSDIMDAVKLPKNSGDTRLVHKYIERLFPKACKGRNRTLPGEPRGYSGLRPAR